MKEMIVKTHDIRMENQIIVFRVEMYGNIYAKIHNKNIMECYIVIFFLTINCSCTSLFINLITLMLLSKL